MVVVAAAASASPPASPEPPLPEELPELPELLELPPLELPDGEPESGWFDDELLLQAKRREEEIDATAKDVRTRGQGFMGPPT